VLIELPTWGLVAGNIGGWLVLQFGLAWMILRLPARWFDRRPGKLSARRETRFYEQFLRVKTWKHRLPDAAPWFRGGFAKRELKAADDDYVRRFILETRRAELCHWLALGGVFLFLIWNPWYAWLGNVVYAVLGNLPCIVAQRYNRSRLGRLATRLVQPAAARDTRRARRN